MKIGEWLLVLADSRRLFCGLKRAAWTVTSSTHLDAAPAHALPRASSALARRGRRPAHPTASWLLQPPATRQPLAPWPLREANIGHLVRVYQLEVQLGLLRRKRLNGVEAGLPLAEESSACPEPRLSSKVHERSGHKLVSGQERPDQTG